MNYEGIQNKDEQCLVEKQTMLAKTDDNKALNDQNFEQKLPIYGNENFQHLNDPQGDFQFINPRIIDIFQQVQMEPESFAQYQDINLAYQEANHQFFANQLKDPQGDFKQFNPSIIDIFQKGKMDPEAFAQYQDINLCKSEANHEFFDEELNVMIIEANNQFYGRSD